MPSPLLSLPATLTAKEANQTLARFAEALAGHPGAQVLIDASALAHFDSAAVAVLLECRRLAQARGKSCLLNGSPAKLDALAAMYGVDGLLPQPQAVAAAGA